MPLPRLRSNCPLLDFLGTLPLVMVVPSLVVVMLGPSALVADVDTVASFTLLVLAGVVFRWRRLE